MRTRKLRSRWISVPPPHTNHYSSSTANQMLIKVADLCALQDDYRRAIQVYEQVHVAALYRISSRRPHALFVTLRWPLRPWTTI